MAITQSKGKIATGTVPAIENTQPVAYEVKGFKMPPNLDLAGKKRDEGGKGDKDILTRLAALMAKAKSNAVGSMWTSADNAEYQTVMREIGVILTNTSVEGLRGVANGTDAADGNGLGKLLAAELAK